jgi:hypothetical protein
MKQDKGMVMSKSSGPEVDRDKLARYHELSKQHEMGALD